MDLFQAIFLSLILQSNASHTSNVIGMHPPAQEHNIQLGEKVQYKLYYGLIPVGKAQIFIFNDLYRINRRDCYRIDVQAKTVGAVDWLAQVEDTWGAYIDKVSLLPHMAYRDISEGDFKRKEIVRYDHRTQTVEVKILNNKTGQFHEPNYYHVPLYIRDLVSGMMAVRSIPFDTVQIGDTLQADAFFEETLYDFKVIYDGQEEIKTKIGRMMAHRLVPIMPDNPVFDGENSVVCWVSADSNQIPIRMEADMFIGAASLEILTAEGLAEPMGDPEEEDTEETTP
ncbi:MAG TPA: DUF3108 domain-containing protein [Cytophagales bacterium]|nr:DUF3108 domain-containing protein [Cytophagales bacterium]HAA23634.1 DUF3108 domain-containing protein [Cytophagales bacterium]HAP65357.1 DUF3108 domain-containing protein [Cytophagales bacterium]